MSSYLADRVRVCAFAVGDGALAVTCVHQYLARAAAGGTAQR